jgi:hypothetical protein
MATSKRQRGPYVVDNGLIMVSGMGMVVKPGALAAPLRGFGA